VGPHDTINNDYTQNENRNTQNGKMANEFVQKTQNEPAGTTWFKIKQKNTKMRHRNDTKTDIQKSNRLTLLWFKKRSPSTNLSVLLRR